MPRDGSGIYTRPPGTNAVPDTTIESTKYNGFVGDVETDLNAPRPIIAGGTGSSTAAGALTALGAVAKAGDTMTGALTVGVASDATLALQAGGVAGNRFQVTGDAGAGIGTKILANTGNGVTYDTTFGAPTRWANNGVVRMTMNYVGDINMLSAGASTSTTTGALVVAGGAGIGGSLHAGGAVYAKGVVSTIVANSTVMDVNGSGASRFMAFGPDAATIGSTWFYNFKGDASGSINWMRAGSAGEVTLSSTVASTSVSTGALTVAGGAGISGTIWCNAVNINNWTMPANSGALRVGSNNANGATIVTRPSADPSTAMQFENFNGGIVGSIGTSASNTSFNTSSDMRLKEDFKPLNAGGIIDSVEVHNFKWRDRSDRDDGALAQQVYDVYPRAVTHDADKDWWGIDYSKFVPLLLQEIKDLRKRVKQLEQGEE